MSMNDIERKAWLDGLKIGDKVIVDKYTIMTIKKITPKRFFVMENGTNFNRDGMHLFNGWQHEYIQPWSQLQEEIIKKINIHIGYINQIEHINWRKVKFSKLERIINILNEE